MPKLHRLMNRIGQDNFRLVAAYLLPGLVILWAISWHVPAVATWLATANESQPTVGGFLYLTLGSLAAGLTASTIRWATVDTLHHWTGLRAPARDFARLNRHLEVYQMLETNHYHYYQWHANMFVALCFAIASRRWGDWWMLPDRLDMALLVLAVILFAGSRDTLRKYYHRVAMLHTTSGDQ